MDDLDYIKDKVRIVDLCGYAGIPVQRNGFINCIFHQENTPSLSIKVKENFFKCFGCGESGSVIDFYMQLYRKELPDAIKELKSLAGISNNVTLSLSKREPSSFDKLRMTGGFDIPKIKECMSKDELYIFDERLGIGLEFNGTSEKETELSNKAAIRAVQNYRLEKNKEIFFELYTYCLKHFGRDEAFINYLVNERRLSRLTIERFDLFFVGNYNQVSNHLKKVFPIGDLQRSGLYNDDGNMIFFKHRIIIPYKFKNEIVYLRGRYFGDSSPSAQNDKSFCKYLGLRNDELNLNTPKRFFNIDVTETMLYDEHIYITEGEFDSMVLTELGFNSIAIAGVGNIPSDKWLRKLLPFRIYLVPDNDAAGEQLKRTLSERFLNLNKTIYIKRLKAKDPTELVREVEECV